MDVWFSIEEEPPPRGAKASWRDLKTFVCAPPKRIRRALALLTKTYHGCRLLEAIVRCYLVVISAYERITTQRRFSLRDNRDVRILAARPTGSSRGGVDRWCSPSLAIRIAPVSP